MNLTDPYGLVHRTATDSVGSFSFTSLPAGDFVLSPTAPPGSLETALPGPVTLGDDGTITGLLFGLYRPFSTYFAPFVSGTVFLDRNGNGAIDGFDRPLSNASIVLGNSTGFRAVALSSADGTFRFENLTPGDYVLSETISPGFTQTFPKSPAISYSFTLSSGEHKNFLFLNH